MHPEIDRFAHLDSWLHRWDPRWKIVSFAVIVVAIAVDRPEVRIRPELDRDAPATLGFLVLSLALVFSSKIPLRFCLRKLRPAAILLLLR